ncbi:hypothetical protein [uncultured Campylobacter sp.]|uniref:hypothetical protein n=1 Tax=uncultured Campylobacter sp. TaxID=218934 RepID=UPI00261E8B3E|nr:hypothetical protein [uncultured Campylobacter sp.]
MLKLSRRASSKLNHFIETHAWLCDSGAFAWFCLCRRYIPSLQATVMPALAKFRAMSLDEILKF